MPQNASSKRDKQSLNYILRSGFAGGVAGCVAKTVVAPLDRVKILFQASNPEFQKYAGTWSGAFRAAGEIYKEYGVRGLLQGHSATLLRVFPYAAIKFMAYERVHHMLMPTRESETNLRRFTAGSISGSISVFFTYPLELIRVRLAFQTRSVDSMKSQGKLDVNAKRPNFTTAISEIYRESIRTSSLPNTTSTSQSQLIDTGKLSISQRMLDRYPIMSFYRGFGVTVLGMIPYAGTSFLVWGYLRSILSSSRISRGNKDKSQSSTVADLSIGAVSGAVAQTISYPLEVVRRRMQVGGLTSPSRWLSLRETIGVIWKRNGWRGFFVGLSVGYLKIVPMTAVSYTVWEHGKRLLGI